MFPSPYFRVSRFLLGLSVAAGVSIASTPYQLPRVSSLGFSTPTTRSPGDPLTLAWSLAPGSMPVMQASFDFRNGNTVRRFYIAQSGAPVTVGTDWPNGTYTLDQIWLNDSPGNGATFYAPNGTLSYTDQAWLDVAPGGPTDLSRVSFTISGANSLAGPIVVTSITRTGNASVAMGTPITFTVNLSDTLAAHSAFAMISLTGPNDYPGSSAYLTMSGSQGTATITPMAYWPNGPYSVRATIGQDQGSFPYLTSHTEFYVNYGGTYLNLPNNVDVELTGGGVTATPPALLSVTKDPVVTYPGPTFSYSTSPSGAVAWLEFADPLGYSHIVYGFTAYVKPTWPNGRYTLQKVTLFANGRPAAIYYRDGTADVLPSQRINHSINFTAVDFDFAGGWDLPIAVSTPPASATIKPGDSTTLSVTPSSTINARYQWYVGPSGDTSNPISGATGATLSVRPASSTTYWVRVSNGTSSANSQAATVTIAYTSNLPVFVTQPTGADVNAGATVTLSAFVVGPSPLAYQWYHDGAAVAGATSTSLAFTAIQPAQAGKYYLTSTNGSGSANSQTVDVLVQSAPTIVTQPTSQTALLGKSATFTFAATGGGLTYAWTHNGQSIAGATTTTLTLNNIQWADAGTYKAWAQNRVSFASSSDATLTVTTETPQLPTITSAPQDVVAVAGNHVGFGVAAVGTPPLTYVWRKDGTDIPSATDASYSWYSKPGDAGVYTVVVGNAAGTVSASAKLVLIVSPTITAQPRPQTVSVGDTVTLSVTEKGGTPPIQYQWYKVGSPTLVGATNATFTIPNAQVSDTGQYSCQLTNAAGFMASDAVQVTVVPAKPYIITSPVSVMSKVGSAVVLEVTALGAGELHYQWVREGAPIAGATTSSLRIASAATDDSGHYTAVVTNANGSTTSDAASVIVVQGPSITEQPLSGSVTIGQNLRFQTFSNEGSYQLQWYRNGQVIPGWTGNLEYLNSTRASDMGFYWCAVTDRSGLTTTSRVATVCVDDGTSSRPVNISTRARVDAAEPLIAGFVLSSAKTVLVRAAGPSLGGYGVSGTLSDPRLSIVPLGGSEPIAKNDDWGAAANADAIRTTATAVSAFPFAAGSKDAAILVHLDAGAYTALVTSGDGSAGVALVEVYDADGSAGSGQLINISGRAQVGSGENVLIVGFVVAGTAPRKLLVRAVGPGLKKFGVGSTLEDPQLSIVTLGTNYEVAANDNWCAAQPIKAAMASVGAFDIDDTSKDAALVTTLPPGAYTAVVSGVGGATGSVLVEVYDLGQPTSSP